MECYYHSDIDAVATCAGCGKGICQDCAVDVAGKIYCQQCVASRTLAKAEVRETRPMHTLAIVSLGLGILGLLGCLCGGSIGGILFGIPAAITGWIARKQLLETQQEQQGLELATVGLGLGIAETIISMVLLVLVGAGYGICFFTELLQQQSFRP